MSEKLYLHDVVIKKPMPLEQAQEMAQKVINDKKKTFYRETEESYRFRNIPKTKFKQDSFKSKMINDNLTLIFGYLK